MSQMNALEVEAADDEIDADKGIAGSRVAVASAGRPGSTTRPSAA